MSLNRASVLGYETFECVVALHFPAAMSCPSGMTYMSCGPAHPRTCYSGEGNSVTSASATCVEGCFCRDGYVREGSQCIQPEQCGCEHNGFYYPVSMSRPIFKVKFQCNSVELMLIVYTYQLQWYTYWKYSISELSFKILCWAAVMLKPSQLREKKTSD